MSLLEARRSPRRTRSSGPAWRALEGGAGRARGRASWRRRCKQIPGRPGPRLPAGRPVQEGRALRRRRRALPRPCCRRDRSTARARTTWPTSSSRAGSSRPPSPATSRGSSERPPPRAGGHVLLQPVAGPPAAFEYQPAQEARSQADRLDGASSRSTTALWKYDKGDYAVVDLGLTVTQSGPSSRATPQGVGREERRQGAAAPGGRRRCSCARAEPLHRAVAGRSPCVVVAHLASGAGKRMFTMRCVKCGTPFCRRCHLGAAAGGLCTQCHHLFVVRDGVSGPARNQKLLEVQKEEGRREPRLPAPLRSSPRAPGQLYAQRTLLGLVFVLRLVRWWPCSRSSPGASCRSRRPRAPCAGPGAWAWPRSAARRSTCSPTAARPDFESADARPARRRAPGAAGRPRSARWPSKEPSRTSGFPTSSSSSGCSGRPAS